MLYFAIVSIIWAFSFGIIGSSLTGVDSYLVATLRLASASLVFLPFLRPKYIQGIDGLRLFVYGFIQFGLMYVCYMKAYQYLPSHLVALFSIFTPIYVVVINDIRKRQFSVQYLMAALLSIMWCCRNQSSRSTIGRFLDRLCPHANCRYRLCFWTNRLS